MEAYLKAFQLQLIAIVVVSDVDLVVTAEIMNVAIVVASDVDLVVAAGVMNVVIVVVSDVDLELAAEFLLVKVKFCLKSQTCQGQKEMLVHLLLWSKHASLKELLVKTMVEETNLHLLLGIIFSRKK